MEKGTNWKNARDGLLAVTLVGSIALAGFGLMALLAGMKQSGTEAMLASTAGVLLMLPLVQVLFALKGQHLGMIGLVGETVLTGGLGIVFLLIRYFNSRYEQANAQMVFRKGKNGEFFSEVAY